MYSYGPQHMAEQKQDDQLEHTYSSYVRIPNVALKTCQKRWMIGRIGERGSGISMLAARHDDDDDDDLKLFTVQGMTPKRIGWWVSSPGKYQFHYDINLHLIAELQSWSFGNVANPILDFTLRSTLGIPLWV